MIAQLGILKDEGLLLTGLIETIKQVIDCIEEEAPGKALTLLGGKQRKMQEILYDSEVITKMFFKEKQPAASDCRQNKIDLTESFNYKTATY